MFAIEGIEQPAPLPLDPLWRELYRVVWRGGKRAVVSLGGGGGVSPWVRTGGDRSSGVCLGDMGGCLGEVESANVVVWCLWEAVWGKWSQPTGSYAAYGVEGGVGG